MNDLSLDDFLSLMFRWRRITLRAGAVLVVLLVAMGFLDAYSYKMTSQVQLMLLIPLNASILLTFLLVLTGSVITSYHIYQIGIRLVGLKYALGHVLICLLLANLLLIGIMLIPLLVQSDVERLA